MMDKLTESMGAATGVPIPEEAKPPAVIDELVVDIRKRAKENLSADYETARQNMQYLIQQSISLIPDLTALVRQAESPRMFESASAFMKMVAELNVDMLEITERMSEEKVKGKLAATSTETPSGPSSPSSPKAVVAFVGTGGDLFNALGRQRGEGLIDVNPRVEGRD